MLHGRVEIIKQDFRKNCSVFQGQCALRLKFTSFTHKSLVGTKFESQELRFESEGNAEAAINHPLEELDSWSSLVTSPSRYRQASSSC
jgi:hypothetical protein